MNNELGPTAQYAHDTHTIKLFRESLLVNVLWHLANIFFHMHKLIGTQEGGCGGAETTFVAIILKISVLLFALLKQVYLSVCVSRAREIHLVYFCTLEIPNPQRIFWYDSIR